MIDIRWAAKAKSSIDNRNQQAHESAMVSITNPYHGFESSRSKRKGHCHTPGDAQPSLIQPHPVETRKRQPDEEARGA